MNPNPYKVGSIVVGDDFYGRSELIESLLSSTEGNHWLVGVRRMGKSSLLLQLNKCVQKPWIPLYVSLDGIYSSKELAELFEYQVSQCLDLVKLLKIDNNNIPTGDFIRTLLFLDLMLQKEKRKMILLLDEGDFLKEISTGNDGDKEFLPKFKRLLEQSSCIKVIMASSPILFDMLSSYPKFLQIFVKSYVSVLNESESASLIRQSQREKAVYADDSIVKTIHKLSGGYPYLTQYTCLSSYNRQTNSISGTAISKPSNNIIIDSIFNENFNFLKPTQKNAMKEIAEHGNMPPSFLVNGNISNQSDIDELVCLGYLRLDGQLLDIGNDYLRIWMSSII